MSFCIELFCVVTLQYQILVRIAIAYFIIEKRKAAPQPWQAIAQRFCSIRIWEMPMKKFLNDIRSAENPISGNRKIINTIAILFLGIALGTFSKYLDFRQTELPGVLMAINGVLDIGNFLGRFAIWILIAL